MRMQMKGRQDFKLRHYPMSTRAPAGGRISQTGAVCSVGLPAPEDFMELFKTALFNGEFDDGPEEMGETGVAWLRAAAETSKRRYGFTRCSVVRMLLGGGGERSAAGPGGAGKFV